MLNPKTVIDLASVLTLEDEAFIVGGQAVSLLAEYFAAKAPELAEYGPLTSKDVDYFGKVHKSNAPLEREIHTYSNMGQFDISKHVHQDNLFNSPAHLSTSLSPTKAREHNTDRSSHKDSPHVLHLKLPKGYSGGRYIAPYSKFPEEQEMLLKPDQKFKITGKTELENCTVHHAEPVDHINEEKTDIPNIFATIHTKGKDRPKGFTGKQITKMNAKANKTK